MRVAFIADVHLGNHKVHGGKLVAGLNERCRQTLHVLREALDYASFEHGVDAVVSLGDLFDTVRPEPQLITEVMQTFGRYSCPVMGARIEVLLGNHERVSGVDGDHALGPLRGSARVHDRPRVVRIGSGPDEGTLAMVPFQAGVSSEWLPGVLEKLLLTEAPPGALCLHMGLRDPRESNKWANEAADAIDVGVLAELCYKYRIPRVYAGNWHRGFSWDFEWPATADRAAFSCRLTQVGALVPTGWDNPGLEGYGGMELLGCSADRVDIPGPRFVTSHSGVELKALLAAAEKSQDRLYVQAKAPPSELLEVRAAMAGFRDASRADVQALDVVPDRQMIVESARKASAVSRSASTLDEAVDKYMAEIELPGVNKDVVRGDVRRYLGLGG